MNSPTTLPPVKDLQTRFLHTFFFRERSVTQARECLLQVKVPSRNKEEVTVWRCPRAHDLYEEELLSHVVKFLFGGSSGCDYLRINEAVGNRWFNKTVVELHDGARLGLRLVTPPLIEMFLSNYGVGILSIALKPDIPDGIDVLSSIDFNYRLSQLRPTSAARLRTPHPSDDVALWPTLTSQQQQEVSIAPEAGAHVFERLGRAGGSILFGELVDELVRPLGKLEFEREQSQLRVYTTAHFGAEVDFSDVATCRLLAPVLSALAQVEEVGHAGSSEGVVAVANSILNRRHWFGVGLLGAAHLVTDQEPSNHPFNSARMPRVMLKYFTPYLTALMQRIVLNRASKEAGEIVLAQGNDTEHRFVGLRRYLLEFAVEGSFTEVSRRDVIHRYYGLCRETLSVPDGLESLRRAVSDIDARNATQRQIQIVEDLRTNAEAARGIQTRMNYHLALVARVQTMVEWIEIIIVSVYFAHLWDIFASHIPRLHKWVSPGVLIAAAIGAICTATILKPWRHQHPFPELEKETSTNN